MDGVDGVGVLGRNVRRIRRERQLSLGTLARGAGLAKQTLANLESGSGNPTVETLLAVARALGVGVNWLVTEWGSPVLVQRAGDAAWDDLPTGRRRTLDRTFGSGQVSTTVVELGLGDEHVSPAGSPGTLHHAYVLSGSLLAGPVGETQALQAADFVRFPGDVPHVLRAVDGAAVVHVVTTVPQVQQFSPR
jgi:transcriptional regulator with XRE-family HTH domain